MDLVKHVVAWAGATLLIVLPAGSQAARAPFCGTQQWQTFIEEAASQFAIPPSWIHAVMRAESAGCVQMNGKHTTSAAGAMGLMQLMPTTWAMLRDRLGLGDDPHDPRDNILAGTAYLAELHARYGRDGAFAAYHAGPRRYDEHVAGTRSLPAATRAYTAHVQRLLGSGREDSPAAAPSGTPATGEIFVRKRHEPRAATLPAEHPIPRPLFAPLTRGGALADRCARRGPSCAAGEVMRPTLSGELTADEPTNHQPWKAR
jgi:hypothetical protein